MAPLHATPGEFFEVQAYGSKLPSEKTAAQFNLHDLGVMRLVFHQGTALPPHMRPGEVTIQWLEGVLSRDVDDRMARVEGGEFEFPAYGAPHSVMVLTDASVLVTI